MDSRQENHHTKSSILSLTRPCRAKTIIYKTSTDIFDRNPLSPPTFSPNSFEMKPTCNVRASSYAPSSSTPSSVSPDRDVKPVPPVRCVAAAKRPGAIDACILLRGKQDAVVRQEGVVKIQTLPPRRLIDLTPVKTVRTFFCRQTT